MTDSMTPGEVAAIMFGGFVVLIVLRIPVSFALALTIGVHRYSPDLVVTMEVDDSPVPRPTRAGRVQRVPYDVGNVTTVERDGTDLEAERVGGQVLGPDRGGVGKLARAHGLLIRPQPRGSRSRPLGARKSRACEAWTSVEAWPSRSVRVR